MRRREVDVQIAAVRDLHELRVRGLETQLAAALAAIEKATAKAETAVDHRLAGLNELRGIVTDISALQLPRFEANTRFAVLTERLDRVQSSLDRLQGRALALAGGGAILGGLTVGALLRLIGGS